MDNNSFCFNEYFLEDIQKNDEGKGILFENLQYASHPERIAWHLLLEYKLSFFELQKIKQIIRTNDWIQMEKRDELLREIMIQENFHWWRKIQVENMASKLNAPVQIEKRVKVGKNCEYEEIRYGKEKAKVFIYNRQPEEHMSILEIYEPLANKDSDMMIRLAGFYEFGYHNEVKVNFQKALSWYEKAVSCGNTRAQEMLNNMNSLGMSATFETEKDKKAYQWLRKWDLVHDEEDYRRMLKSGIEGSEISMIGELNDSDDITEFFGIMYDERGLEVHIPIIMSFTYENKDYIVAYNDGMAWGFTYKKHNQVLMLSDIKTKDEYEMIQNEIDVLCHKIRTGKT